MSDDPEWLIYRHRLGWYLPNAQGFTNDVSKAGRYTYADALSTLLPNGSRGPHDGISVIPVSETKIPMEVKPTPFPAGYDDLVFDTDGWSQTIIIDGQRPEWLRDNDLYKVGRSGRPWDWASYKGDAFAIRIRRREPKRETATGTLSWRDGFRLATFDLIDGVPDPSTLKLDAPK